MQSYKLYGKLYERIEKLEVGCVRKVDSQKYFGKSLFSGTPIKSWKGIIFKLKNILQTRIGIIGGGQLGKMMILEAKRLGLYVVTLDPAPDCPSHSISDEHIIADFHAKDAIFELADKVDVITYEFEHINAEALAELEQKGHTVYPSVSSLKSIQDKFLQKAKLSENGVKVPDFKLIENLEQLYEFSKKNPYPFMLKSCKDGYDGKGNFLVQNEVEIETGFTALKGYSQKLMTEKFIDFSIEVSTIATRGINGEKVIYPIAHNVHKDSILETTTVPAVLSEKTTKNIRDIAEKVMDIFDGVGTFCVEMFVGKNDEIYVNEVAPRPHNSGHYTIEGCRVNQFENHIRAIIGLSLGCTKLLHSTVIMRNLLGKSGSAENANWITKAYKESGVNVHIYGKSEPKPQRKTGHYTITANSIQQAQEIDGKILNSGQ